MTSPDPSRKPLRQGELAALLRTALNPWENEPELTATAAAQDASSAGPQGEDAPGHCIGPYQLREILGEGGFGIVWRAEQSHPIQRQVALKITKVGMDSGQVVSRFNMERQTLALMDHPGIAAVYDAGSSSNGRPYFVMELVHGQPITTYCREKNLSIDQRLRLFIQACHAVQHAHQKGVLHRDLKPNNILITEVDGEPIPKIIDFGIAKALDPTSGTAIDSLLTRQDVLLGTPAYMSPEQTILGNPDLDTRTDIYSLGVILYELLTGRTPLSGAPSGRTTSLEEVLRSVQQASPARPSNVVRSLPPAALPLPSLSPAELGRQLAGDLDWIILKALEKNRNDRYESADALAKDILNHLHDLPTFAGRPSLVHSSLKFARRHRTAVAAVAIVTVTLISAAAFATHAYLQENRMRLLSEDLRQRAEAGEAEAELHRDLARENEKAAVEERQKAQATLNYLSRLLELTGEFADQGKNPEALRLALDALSEEIDQFGSTPEIRETISGKTALIYRYLKDEKSALRHAREQLEFLAKSRPSSDPFLLDAREVYARGLYLQGSTQESHAQFDEVIKQWMSQLKTRDGPRKLFLARSNRAEVWSKSGRLEEALVEFDDIHKHATNEVLAHSSWPVHLRRHGSALTAANRLQEAADVYAEALQSLNITNSKNRQNASTLYLGQSRLYVSLFQLAPAIASLERGIMLQQQARGQNSAWLPEWWIELSRLYTAQHRHMEAITACQNAINIATNTGQKDMLDRADRALGENLEAAGRHDLAAPFFLSSHNLQAQSPAPPPQAWLDLASALRNTTLSGGNALAGTHSQALEQLLLSWNGVPERDIDAFRVRTDLAHSQLAAAEAQNTPFQPHYLEIGKLLATPLIKSYAQGKKPSSFPWRQQALEVLQSTNPPEISPRLYSRDFLALSQTFIDDRWAGGDHAADLFRFAAALRLTARHRDAVAVYLIAAGIEQQDVIISDRRQTALMLASETLRQIGDTRQADDIICGLRTRHQTRVERIKAPDILQTLGLRVTPVMLLPSPLPPQTPSPPPPGQEADGVTAASP